MFPALHSFCYAFLLFNCVIVIELETVGERIGYSLLLLGSFILFYFSKFVLKLEFRLNSGIKMYNKISN